MYSTGLVVFRESLEAALFVGIIAASTRSIPQRSIWLVCAVLAGIAGSVGLAFAMERINDLAQGIGQELMNVGVTTVALTMLTWHCFWVSRHGKEMALDARHIGLNAANGSSTLGALALATTLAVLREGAETVIFVAGLLTGSTESQAQVMLAASLGLLAGAASGVLIYFSLARIKTQQLFRVTNALILLLAGSLASQLAKNLAQADLITLLNEPAWDISHWVSNDSPVGFMLHALMGYDAQPSGLQLLFYVGVIVLIGLISRRVTAGQMRHQPNLAVRSVTPEQLNARAGSRNHD